MKPFRSADEIQGDVCPKCLSQRGWAIQWKDAEAYFSDGTPGTHDWYMSEHIAVACHQCGWTYEMQPADKVPAE